MTSGGLEQLLTELHEVAHRRAATEPGTQERAELDVALLAVQERIRSWSDDEPRDDSPSGEPTRG